MSSPGFTGGGGGGGTGFPGRSMAAPPPNMNHPATTTTTAQHNLHPSHPLYRTQQQLPAIFLDPTSQQQQQRQNPTLMGKRTLAEFQTHNHNHNHNQAYSNFLLRSVKPRTFHHHASPFQPNIDFSISPEFPNLQSHRFSMPLLHHLRPNPINLPNTNNLSSYPNSNFALTHNRIVTQEPEKKIIDYRLQELEKQLLEDNDDEEGDAVSVITNSEWSETIQNLITPQNQNQTQTQKPVSSSPTSSTTSSNSSISVASPASSCSKHLLTEAASAISEGKLEAASEIITRLGRVGNQPGNSDQRFTDCMVSALKSRINQIENPPPVVELFSREHAESTQLLFEHSLCFKLSFMAANLGILEAAFEDANENNNNSIKFCVVDFNVGFGKQYEGLLHALSARLNGKTATVKIVAITENGAAADERLKAVGDMLGRQAERLRIGFEFKVVTHKLAELTRDSLGIDSGEVLAVNFAFKLYRMPDESVSTENPRDELLRRVKSLAPLVVTLVEQEVNTNTAPFVARVAESCSYYGAVFDSIESNNSERVKVEEGLSRKIGNSVACEGRDRVERCEVFGKWRARMGMAGFKLEPLSQSMAELLGSQLGSGNRVTVKEENGGVCFGWMGRTLTVASAWR